MTDASLGQVPLQASHLIVVFVADSSCGCFGDGFGSISTTRLPNVGGKINLYRLSEDETLLTNAVLCSCTIYCPGQQKP